MLMRGINLDEVSDFVEMTRNRPIDYRFIEFMPFSMNGWDEKRMVSYGEAVQEIVKSYPDFVPCENDPNSTSKVQNASHTLFRTMSMSIAKKKNELRLRIIKRIVFCIQMYKVPGFMGRVGFISSMTDDYCDSCNRLRLTADGHLKACLFQNNEVDLRYIFIEFNRYSLL